MYLCNSNVINAIFPIIGPINIYFEIGKLFYKDNKNKVKKTLLNIILPKL